MAYLGRASPASLCGPRWGIARCGKSNAVNPVADTWMGMGVGAAGCARALMVQWTGLECVDAISCISFLQTRHEVRPMCTTRNQFRNIELASASGWRWGTAGARS